MMEITTGHYTITDETGKMKFIFKARYDPMGFPKEEILHAKRLLKLKGLKLAQATKEEVDGMVKAKKQNSCNDQILLPGVPSGMKKIKGVSHFDVLRGK